MNITAPKAKKESKNLKYKTISKATLSESKQTTDGKIKKKSIKISYEDIGREKNPGRNSTSNIFRVFLKFCTKPKL